MTVCAAIKLRDGSYLCGTDSAIGYASGYRRSMPVGKWWDYTEEGGPLILESGGDFALSRIRRTFEAKEAEPSVDLLVDVIHEVADRVASKVEGVEDLNAELLYVDATLDGLYVLGGDGGVTGPYDWTTVGHGAPLMTVALSMSLPVVSRRGVTDTQATFDRAFIEVARGADSVHDPFYFKRVR